ncbi:DUF2938 domain-containing protein [Marinobacter xestospongiae]|uniref:DUF2938 domain-containing protein n=1 Tax=Marinobacter xestospongiae TaxID=994319 RepID=UPI002004EACB|nr:DUF2938 domain-containing protein [Marinobacter xestospongiae]MCK7568075.1 DUF2938 domain-containing protein [Marinobacter xestospongiae]
MSTSLELLFWGALVGTGATVVMDLWAWLARRLLGMASLDWALVGRWVGQLAQGNWRHGPIAKVPSMAGERALGWAVHYAVGVIFGVVLLQLWGLEWALQPTPGPALAFGVLTVAAPFLVMQPALGAGVAASRTPNPAQARFRSLLTHAVFGLGLYLSALLLARWITA